MRRSLGKISNTPIGNATKQALLPSSAAVFSTSAGGAGGRGRGRGASEFSKFQVATPGRTDPEPVESQDEAPVLSGAGRGRGKPPASDQNRPTFASFVPSMSSSGRGRGGGGVRGAAPPHQEYPQPSPPSKPNIFLQADTSDSPTRVPISDRAKGPEERSLPTDILSVFAGAGRGKPVESSGGGENAKGENRHIRPRQPGTASSPPRGDSAAASGESKRTPKLSREESVSLALGILSKAAAGEEGKGGRVGPGRGGRGGRGRGGRGFRGRGGRGRRVEDADEHYSGLYLGDNADGEKLAQKFGPDFMNQLAEGFEEMSDRILPSPVMDEYLEAFDLNMKIECEPEYLMGDFDSNPDIDEEPPISLRDAFDKQKPFLMAYLGIESHEEWEEVMKETMETVPLMKEIVDHYSGPDRVTAKKQQEELERVAKTLPAGVPNSVKRFADRAVLSLQSNPGWGFDKKCQFMDKLAWRVSHRYKEA